jgi:hypothetical protein
LQNIRLSHRLTDQEVYAVIWPKVIFWEFKEGFQLTSVNTAKNPGKLASCLLLALLELWKNLAAQKKILYYNPHIFNSAQDDIIAEH